MITNVKAIKGVIYVYGESNAVISSMPKGTAKIISFNSEEFHVKDGIYIWTYDSYCNRLRLNNSVSVWKQLSSKALEPIENSLLKHQARLGDLITNAIRAEAYETSAKLRDVQKKMHDLIELINNIA